MNAEPEDDGRLAQVRIVLVQPQHPGNIGAAARAMKNFGLGDLALVAPREFPHPQARAMAVHAHDVLERARIFPDLASALEGRGRVYGTSARMRSVAHNVGTPRDLCAGLRRRRRWPPLAVVFGSERSGLTNEQIDLCHELLTIPTEAESWSLNLAAAVGIVSYELRMAVAPQPAAGKARQLAAHEDVERFYEHLERTLLATGFLNPDNPRMLMRRLRRLFGRAAPDDNEAKILRGILSSVDEVLQGRVRGRRRATPDGLARKD